ncbi:MAG: EFR1 family ferrodoxin [Peptostreptococcaceae bacterium]
MIFYFSGTGNSLYIAKNIGNEQNERLISISKEMNKEKEVHEYYLKKDEKIIFVYPVYAWAPPKMVIDFVSKLKLNNYQNNYISSITTCGGDIGDSNKLFSKILKNKGLRLNSGFSIVMPNNYIIMGDVDNKLEENQKLTDSQEKIKYINNVIKNKDEDIFELDKGNLPLLTYVVNPLFNKFALGTKDFHVTDKCTQCGICEKVCNAKCIKVEYEPKWSGNCTQCLACISYCPTKAIQYGKSTLKKGRYTNPYISLSEIIE